jgi:hypothetical protein
MSCRVLHYTNRVPARPRRVDEQRREALHPPVQGDVVNIDPAPCEELLDIAIRQPEPQIPADGENDHLGWEPKAGERRRRGRGSWTNERSTHPTTLVLEHHQPSTQQCPYIAIAALVF